MQDIERKTEPPGSGGIDVETLYTRYAPMVLRRCRVLLKDEEKAVDAMQEVFMKVLTNRAGLNARYPSSLLYRIATNVCLNVIRADRVRQASGEDDILTNIAMVDDHENRLMFGNLLDFIFRREKPGTREIAVMHLVDGMTLNEVAQESGLSVSGVRKRLRELRGRLGVLQ